MSSDSELTALQQIAQIHGAHLFEGERLKLSDDNEGPEIVDDDEINARYAAGEIRIVTEQARYQVDQVPGMISKDNYKLDPDYQRRHRWSTQSKSRLIESFIMNVPVPPIFIFEYELNKYEVMDGLQRLTAIREFYEGIFELEGLEHWPELDGRTYGTLPASVRAGVDRRFLSATILLNETSGEENDQNRLKRFVFGRINTGGVRLSDQEVRNALYGGPLNTRCRELADNPALRRLWSIPENVEELVDQSKVDLVPEDWRSMRDVELVLRFFANRQRFIEYRSNLRGYLDDFLQAGDKLPDPILSSLGELFNETIALAEGLFGVDAFKKWTSRGNLRNEPLTSVFDAVMNVTARYIDKRDELLVQKQLIRQGLPEFYEHNAEVFNLRGQTRQEIARREILFENYIQSFFQ